MTNNDYDRGVETVWRIYPDSRALPADRTLRPLRVAPVLIPKAYWGGGLTRLLIVFDLATHDSARPRGLLGPEWKLPSGAAPMNANPVYEFGEPWQAFSWNFPWRPGFGVLETVEAYLGRFHDHR